MEFLAAEAWIALFTLTFLEVVLGIDNIIFVSIISNRLPKEKQGKARNMGLILALIFRLLLLLGISWIIKMDKEPLFNILGFQPTVKDIILAIGGLFLLGKSTSEIHKKMEGAHKNAEKKSVTFIAAIVQICLLNIVFSFDSILTAIGLTTEILIMVLAVFISVAIMMVFGNNISRFISKHPTLEMLALSFLLLVGFMLIVEGIVFVNGEHVHVPKGYIYFAVFFSLVVELLNMRLGNKNKPVTLHSPHGDEKIDSEK